MAFPLHLRRITSGGRWIPAIDGLRFVAIASVVLFHLSGEVMARSGVSIPIAHRYWLVAALLSHGDRGVRLFFVISGFILGLPFARQWLTGAKPVSLKAYFFRRITRLEPPYILAVVLTAALIYAYKHDPIDQLVRSTVETLLYSFGLINGAAYGVTWSLEVEIQFYILAPLIAYVYRVKNTLARRGLLLAAILLIGLAQHLTIEAMPPGRGMISIAYYLQYFLTGLLLGDLYVLDMPNWRTHWGWDLVSLFVWPAIFLVAGSWWHVVLPFLILPAYLAAFKGPLGAKLFSTPAIALIGGMCYSIYLLHFVIIAAIMKISWRLLVFHDFLLDNLVQMLVMIPIVLLVCGAYYVLVERPCMDPQWPSKLYRAVKGLGAKPPAPASDSVGP